MVLTIKEQAVIKEWNKRGLSGLRTSSLDLLDNIGVRVGEGGDVGGSDEKSGVDDILIRHTLSCMPEGLWGDARKHCEEICFLAGVDFSMEKFVALMEEERENRKDEEFGDFD